MMLTANAWGTLQRRHPACLLQLPCLNYIILFQQSCPVLVPILL
jgi:hypothetical protein